MLEARNPTDPLSLQIHTVNSIAVLRFSPAARYPRLTREELASLDSHLTQLESEKALQGIVIMSNEQSFATGADVGEVAALAGLAARDFALRGQALCGRIAAFPSPVVAAIRGFCLGGGLDLALACHGRVAAFNASFGHPGGALGLVTGWGGTQRLPRLVGKAQALQLLLSGERMPATQALTLGLVDELTASQDLENTAIRCCERLAEIKRTQNGTRE
jgi:enoyl-CoA hydratase